MKILRHVLIAAVGCLASSALFAGDLAGYWKNDEQPTWIEIQVESDSAIGTVRRNDNKPEAVGRILLKDVVGDEDKPGSWRGQIYAERFEEYKDARISLPEPDRMEIKVKVGFMSRTVTWTRAAALPVE
jgi:uncharacterized protein (DUF2147 family)